MTDARARAPAADPVRARAPPGPGGGTPGPGDGLSWLGRDRLDLRVASSTSCPFRGSPAGRPSSSHNQTMKRGLAQEAARQDADLGAHTDDLRQPRAIGHAWSGY